LDAQGFAAELRRLLDLYPQPITDVQFNLLGSHDTPRFKTLARNDTTAYRLATLVQMTYPGAPSIYYGDEIGLDGGHDPGCRGAFPWDEVRWDKDLYQFTRRCIALRQGSSALRQGEFHVLFAENGVVAYGRRLGAETFLVVLNSNRQPVTIDLDVGGYLERGAILQDVWDDNAPVAETQGRLESLRLDARAGRVLKAIQRI
jgi:neopullulanase